MSVEINPRIDLGGLKERRAVEASVVADSGNISSNGVALENVSRWGLQERGLADGALGPDGIGVELGDVQLHIIVLGSNDDLESTEVSGVGVESLEKSIFARD
jgi:hypothetical protein